MSDAEPAVPHADGGYRAGARCRAPRTRAACDLCTGARRHGLAVVLALPALLPSAIVCHERHARIALKTFINVSLVLGVSWTLTWSRMSAALKMLHLPDEVIFTFDMALKHIEVLGRTAHNLCESVMLRSVGHAPEGFSRTDSLAGIMGMTFIKAMNAAAR
ncbi:MAG: energy-coupling factor transporter transmembrane component T [Collinsella sp.]